MDRWMLGPYEMLGGTGTAGVTGTMCVRVHMHVCVVLSYFYSQVTECEAKKAEQWFAAIVFL